MITYFTQLYLKAINFSIFRKPGFIYLCIYYANIKCNFEPYKIFCVFFTQIKFYRNKGKLDFEDYPLFFQLEIALLIKAKKAGRPSRAKRNLLIQLVQNF